jgi:aminoglycoside 6'-N-acetyltransferase
VPSFSFDPLGEEDLPLARRWLLEPHVRRWWDDYSADGAYPESVLERWRKRIRGEQPTDMFRIDMGGRPIGVIQSYRVDDYPEHAAELGGLDEPAFEVDLFIGEPDLIGKGHGAALLREFLREGFDRYRVDYCVIGPSKQNTAAIRSYEKVGFRYLKDYREDDTKEPEHVLLAIRRRDL